EWRRVMAVNLDGTFFCCQAAYKQMKAAAYGRIINLSSTAVDEGTFQMAHYVATKGGIIGLTHVIATEGGAYGITANAIAPGLILSEGVRAMAGSEELSAMIKAAQPIKRNGEPA